MEATIRAGVARERINANEQEVHGDGHGPNVGPLVQHLLPFAGVDFKLLWTKCHGIALAYFIALLIEPIKTVSKIDNFDNRL